MDLKWMSGILMNGDRRAVKGQTKNTDQVQLMDTCVGGQSIFNLETNFSKSHGPGHNKMMFQVFCSSRTQKIMRSVKTEMFPKGT